MGCMRKTTLLIVLLSASSLFAAGRHRIVGLPSGPLVTITGQVIDAVTRQPVARVEVAGASDTQRANSQGQFSLEVPAGIPATLTFSRSGYETSEQIVTVTESGSRTFELQPLPTASIRTTDDTTHVIDMDSIEFGYVVPFSGSRSSPRAEMCRPGAEPFTLDFTGIKRIIGPAVASTQPACCTSGPVTGARFVLADNQEVTAYFVDSCEYPNIYIYARDHITWERLAISLRDVEEVVVP